MSYVQFKQVQKKYENNEKLSVSDFTLDVTQGEFIVFVGPSGCGKSTTLRMLAGLEEITSGEISIDNKVVNEVHPKDRDIAMVFQNYALYPHMSVYDNIAFGLKIKKMPKKEIDQKVKWASEILGLTSYLSRKPKDLSGGQRQRVALGRAIVRNPKVFLMDEPLSNLDAKLRVNMRNEITKLHRELNATTIYVTHDQVEAMTMADRIVVMKDGVIQQIGSPIEIYNNPANTFVATFVGAPQMNMLEVQLIDGKMLFSTNFELQLPAGIWKKLENYHNQKVIFGFRPEHVSTLKIVLDNEETQTITTKIENLERMGNENHIFINFEQTQVILKIASDKNIKIGDEINFAIDLNKCYFFDIETSRIIHDK